MKLEKFFPSAALMPFVKEFMIIESGLGADSKIIPDTSMIMAFRYKGNVLRTDGEKKQTIPSGVITGLRKSARLLYYEKETANLLIVFKEGGINAFCNIPAHELFDLTISAENLFPSIEVHEMLERLFSAKNNSNRIDIIESFLLKKLIHKRSDPLISNAIQLMKQQSGNIRIKDLASSLYISQDAFEKRFRTRVGATPKQFSSIIRLRNLINKYPSYSSLTDASYDSGYFDQSHFIKDFRIFTGQSPKDFFNLPWYW